jgi:hypothetical protein
MKFDELSDFIIDVTDIGLDEIPLSNDKGSDIIG